MQNPCSTSCKANLPSYLLLKVKLAGDAEASGDVKGQDNALPVEHRQLYVHCSDVVSEAMDLLLQSTT